MPTITLSMIVKNEEKYLHDCLESVKDIVNEIIIVDTGSNDSTIKIAEGFGAKIFHFDWINDFSAARNYSLLNSTSDWILYLDADERLEKKSANELLSKINGARYSAFNCVINNIDTYRNNPKLMKYTRLFKRSDRIKFSGRAHEQIEPSLIENNYLIGDSSIEILHVGYNVSDDILKLKASRNLELLLIEYRTKPTSYLAFQIANSYSILEEHQKQNNYYIKALDDPNLRREFKSICYLNLSDYWMRQNDLDRAKSLVDAGLKVDNCHPSLNMIAAQVYEKLQQPVESLNFCIEAFKHNLKIEESNQSKNVLDIIVDNRKILLEGIFLSLKFNRNDYKNRLLNSLHNIDESYHKNVLNILNNNLNHDLHLNGLTSFVSENNLEQVLKLLKYNNNIDAQLIFYSSTFDRFSNESVYLTNFGSFLLSIGQMEEAEVIFELAMQQDEFDDAVIFYLSSIYASTGNIESLKKIIGYGSERVKANPFLKEKLEFLKNKLSPILNS